MCTDLALIEEDCSKRGTKNKTFLRLTKECLTRVLGDTSLPNLLTRKDTSQDCDPQMDSPALLLPLRCLTQWRISVCVALDSSPSSHVNCSTENSETPNQANCFPTAKPCLCCKRQRKPHFERRVTTTMELPGFIRLMVQSPSAEKTLSCRRCSTCSITVFEQTGTNCGVKPVA